MAVGETLLKITDFPFSYSIIILVFGIWAIDISGQNLFILIGSAGALGTFLSISDPLGWMYRRRLRREIIKELNNNKNNSQKRLILENSIKALETRAIKLETDKLVSIGYFVIILFVFGTIMVQGDMADRVILTRNISNNNYTDTTESNKQDLEVVCGPNCIRPIGWFVSYGAMVLIILIGKKDWNKLKGYLETSAIHQQAISSENVTDNTVTNLSKAIDANDWPTAREWSDLAEKEISIQKGRKDQIIKAVEEIYSPLYLENIQNETAGKEMKRVGEFRYFQRDVWLKIESSTAYLMLDDKGLKEKLESHYEKITRINEFPNAILKICEKILRKRLIEHYGENIENLHYFVKTITGSGAPSLSHLLPFGRHPLEVSLPEHKPERDYIQLIKTDFQYKKLQSDEDFEKFDSVFKIMKQDVEKDPTITETKKLYNEIVKENIELKKILLEKIQSAFKI